MALLDIDSLTLGEIEQIEDETGLLIEELMQSAQGKTRPSTKVLRCLIWAAVHRSDPSFTMDRAREMTLDEMNAVVDASDPSAGDLRRNRVPAIADPTDAATVND